MNRFKVILGKQGFYVALIGGARVSPFYAARFKAEQAMQEKQAEYDAADAIARKS